MGRIECPKCRKQIDDSVRACPHCGFNKISSYLLQIEKNKKSKYIDYTSFHNNIPIKPNNTKNTPKCPTCGSTNIQKILGTKRWLSTGLFVLASSDVGKSMVCRNCGFKW